MDKVCAIFGGSRGIGRAVAQLLALKGYRLAIVARNLDVAQAAASDLGGDHLAFSCDVAKEHDVQNTFEEIQKHLGQINFLVNAAGINRNSLLVRTKTEDMISQLHTNLLGSMLTCRAAMRTMIQQQGGSIVNIGSIIGLKGNFGQSVYSASKGGIVGFSRSLAKEVARKKIRVNVVAPGLGRGGRLALMKSHPYLPSWSSGGRRHTSARMAGRIPGPRTALPLAYTHLLAAARSATLQPARARRCRDLAAKIGACAEAAVGPSRPVRRGDGGPRELRQLRAEGPSETSVLRSKELSQPLRLRRGPGAPEANAEQPPEVPRRRRPFDPQNRE
ncbi:3-oxoacyl-[acyl-carrier-protein] reductase [Eulemur rufifrons]|uniref:3-oxoacyl-[acyl-carrier-protein] reductase n=1 Tax=Eulemur rufifrons TaxID=859984 RepID=UPI0037446CB5